MKQNVCVAFIALILILSTGCKKDLSLTLSGGEEFIDSTNLENIVPEAATSLMNYFRLNSDLMESGLNSIDLTLVGTLDFTPGVLGDAVEFNGDGDHLKFQPTNSTHFTFVAWINLYGPAPGATTQYLLESRAFRIHDRGARRLQFELLATDGSVARWKTSAAETFPYNEWTFIAVTVDLTTPYPADQTTMTKLYMNGIPCTVTLETSVTALARDNTTALGAIGNTMAQNRPTNGAFDEIGIFNTLLTDAQILAIYNAQKP
ncbi:MAG: LamG domain-containing protein [Bdellovibrionota bacterium]